MKNVASGLLFINAEEEKTESHSVIEKGVEWEYENDNDKETLQTTGPLRHGVLVMVKKKEGNKEKGKKWEVPPSTLNVFYFTDRIFG